MNFFRPNVTKLLQKRDLAGLVAVLRHRDKTLRADAVRALHQLQAPGALQPLIEALTDSEKLIRYEAAKALGRFRDEKAINALLQALADPEGHVRRQAAESLSAIGPTAIVPLIAAIARGGEEELCQGATQALADIDDEQAIPGLMLALQDKRGNVRATAVEKLEKRQTAALPFLIHAIEGEDSLLRQRVREVVTRISQTPMGRGLIPEALIGLLVHSNARARQSLMPLLSRVAVSDVSPLVSVLHTSGPEVRIWAYKLLEGYHWQPSTNTERAIYLKVRAEQQEEQEWQRKHEEKMALQKTRAQE